LLEYDHSHLELHDEVEELTEPDFEQMEEMHKVRLASNTRSVTGYTSGTVEQATKWTVEEPLMTCESVRR